MVGFKLIITSVFLLLAISNFTLAMRGPPVNKPQMIGKCNPRCQHDIDQLEKYIVSLYNDHNAQQDKMMQRIIKLEHEIQSSTNLNALNQRLNRFQTYLKGNISFLENLINYDMRHFYDDLHHDVDMLKKDLNNRFHSVTFELNELKHHNGHHGDHPGPHGFTAKDLYRNVTNRLNDLENGVIFQLERDHNLWRSNFRSIDNNFDRIKRNKNCKCQF